MAESTSTSARYPWTTTKVWGGDWKFGWDSWTPPYTDDG